MIKLNIFTVICVFLLCLGCASAPGAPFSKAKGQAKVCCPEFYPRLDSWEVVHRINAVWPFGGRGTFIGITRFAAHGRRIRCIMMTLEGFVLLDVSRNKQEARVHRAMPPFDDPEVVRGLLSDVELMLLPPLGRATEENNGLECRCIRADGGIQVTTRLQGGGWLTRLGDGRGEVRRDVEMFAPVRQGFASRMKLIAQGGEAYSLELILLKGP